MGLSSTSSTVASVGALDEVVGGGNIDGLVIAGNEEVAADDGAAEPMTSVCDAKRTSFAMGVGCNAAVMRCSNVCQISGFGKNTKCEGGDINADISWGEFGVSQGTRTFTSVFLRSLLSSFESCLRAGRSAHTSAKVELARSDSFWQITAW